MTLWIEGFLLINTCMNVALLSMALRWCGRRHIAWRVAAAALLGAGYAALAYAPGMQLLRTLPCSLAVSVTMLLAAADWHRPVAFLRALGLMGGATFLLGGTVYALSQALGGLSMAWQIAIPVALCVGMLLQRSTQRTAAQQQARLRIARGGAQVEIDGLLDSGNLLWEPISGLPVVVVPAKALGELLPLGCNPAALETMPQGFRLVHMVTMGGGKTLMCFHPSAMHLQAGRKWQPVSAMVAVTEMAPAEGNLALVPTSLL